MAKKRQELRPNKRTGRYERLIGWKWHAKTGRFIQPKFYLGTDRAKAELANRRLEELWHHMVNNHEFPGVPPFDHPHWTDESLLIAKAIAKGKTQIALQSENKANAPVIASGRIGEGAASQLRSFRTMTVISGGEYTILCPPESYAEYLHRMTSTYPMVSFMAGDPQLYRKVADLEAVHVSEQIQQVKDSANRLHKLSSGSPILLSESDGLLHAALDEFIDHIRSTHKTMPLIGDVEETSQYGNNLINRTNHFKKQHEDRPLSSITLQIIQEMSNVWRDRPPVKGKKKPISVSYASEQIKVLKSFFRWLHMNERLAWRIPEDFAALKTSVRQTQHDVAAKATPFQVQVQTFTPGQLGLLYKYATPLERLLLLLGINCGFGSMEITTLLMNQVQLATKHPFDTAIGFQSSGNDSFISRMRTKTDVYGEWILWPETVEALQWARQRRQQQTKVLRGKFKGLDITAKPDSPLILSDDGTPLVKLTEAGNRSSRIANLWEIGLCKRIRNDHADFPRLSFGKLRKTATTMIREFAGGEVASLFISHGTPIRSDDLLEAYSNRPFGRLFEAIRALRIRLEPVLQHTAEWPEVRKKGGSNLTLSQIEQIESLLFQDELTLRQIAKKVGVSYMAVYRRRTTHESKSVVE